MPSLDLFIWRHAEAEDTVPDLDRALTPRGHRDAARVAKPLAKRLDEKSCIVCSPAVRTRQTAEPLVARVSLEPRVDRRLAPGAGSDDVLAVLEETIASCGDEATIVMVGHQPWVGQLARRLLTEATGDFAVKKAAAWWLVRRSRDGSSEWTLRSILDPDLV